MDLTKIKSTVLNQLTNTNGLYSLRLQNHLYGCFLIMEDIAQANVNLSETVISTPKFVFDFDKQFSEIGIRYGFVMDTKLILDSFNPEYKATWLEYFKNIDLIRDISEVDKIEDCLIEVVQSCIKQEQSFFIAALDTGALAQEWIEKVIQLINSPAPPPPSPNESDEELQSTAISQAATEKPISSKRRLATTRRRGGNTTNKKNLAKTRRHR